MSAAVLTGFAVPLEALLGEIRQKGYKEGSHGFPRTHR